MSGKKSRDKGHSYERKIVIELKRWFKSAITSRLESKRKDDEKVDICFIMFSWSNKSACRYELFCSSRSIERWSFSLGCISGNTTILCFNSNMSHIDNNFSRDMYFSSFPDVKIIIIEKFYSKLNFLRKKYYQ